MGESALAVAVAECPDTRRAGLQLIVDDDVAALVAPNPGFVETEVVGVGSAADREQQMGAGDFGGAVCAVDPGNDLVALFREADAFGVQSDLDALVLNNVLDRRRY